MRNPQYEAGKVYGNLDWGTVSAQIKSMAPKFSAATVAAGKYGNTVGHRAHHLTQTTKLIDALEAKGASESAITTAIGKAYKSLELGQTWPHILGILLG